MVGVEGGGQRVSQLYYAQEKLRFIDLQEKIAHKEKMKKLQKQKNRAKNSMCDYRRAIDRGAYFDLLFRYQA